MDNFIGVLSLTLGLLGGGVIFIDAVFKTDESKKVKISPAKKIMLLVCLALACFGLAFLLYSKSQSASAFGHTEDQSVEKLIRKNYNEIIQKKNQYQSSDVIQSENKCVNLLVCESAGNMYYYSEDTDEITCESLGGRDLPSVQVILLDYKDDHVIGSYQSDEKGSISHYAEKGDKFYCVAIMSDYELYVTPPVLVIGDMEDVSSGLIGLYLKKADDTYTNPYYIRVNVRDLTQSDQGYDLLSNSYIDFRCIGKECVDHEAFDSMFYGVWTNESGFLSFGENLRYAFELNSRYELDITPGLMDVSTNDMPYFYTAPYETVELLPDNTNVIDIYFDYDGEKWTLYK